MADHEDVKDYKPIYESLKTQFDELKQNYDTLLKDNTSTKRTKHSNEFWDEVATKRKKDPDYIKSLLRNKILDVTDANKYGRTLLHMFASDGDYEMTQLCLNFDADVRQKDDMGDTAVDLAKRWGYTHVEELLLFSEMNVGLEDKIRDTAHTINEQKGIIENIVNELNSFDSTTKEFFEDTLVQLITNIIKKKLSFSDLLLNLCWNILSRENSEFLQTNLWNTITNTVDEIIKTGSKKDWFWLKNFILPSKIWFKDPNEKSDAKNDDDDDSDSDEDEDEEKEQQKKSYLYQQLLKLVEAEAQNQLNNLDSTISDLANKSKNDWNALVKWDIPDKYEHIRQDMVPNGIVAQYSYSQLSENGGSSATFNAHKFVDFNQYLPQLILLAQIVDEEFQKSVQKIFNIDPNTNRGQIKNVLNIDNDDEKKPSCMNVRYMRGPVKAMERARAKAENDYNDQPFPQSACVMDLNRCSLIFDNISTLLTAVDLFIKKVEYYQSGNIIDIVRDKNGFEEYVQVVQYSDIKLNVLIRGKQNNLIGEVQFLLKPMLDYKNKAHNLYNIQRQKEYIENSVSNILPILLNENKQLFVAASKGDVKGVLCLMVYNNKSEEFIMKKDRESGETILDNICAKNRYKAFKLLKQQISTDLFVGKLFGNPMDSAMYNDNYQIIEAIFEMDEIIQKYQNDKDLLELLNILMQKTPDLIEDIMNKISIDLEKRFANCDNEQLFNITKSIFEFGNVECADYIIKELNISNDKFIKNLNKTDKDEGKTMLTQLMFWNQLPMLKKFVSIIGKELFVKHALIPDNINRNAIEVCMYTETSNGPNVEMLKYMLSFTDLVKALINDKELTFRLLVSLDSEEEEWYDQKAVNLISEALKLDAVKLNEIKNYKCKKNEEGKYSENATTFDDKKLSDNLIQGLLNPNHVFKKA